MKQAVSLALLFFGLVFGLIFAAAFSDARLQHCWEWPDAGNCSDARWVMWITGSISFLTMASAVILWRRARV